MLVESGFLRQVLGKAYVRGEGLQVFPFVETTSSEVGLKFVRWTIYRVQVEIE